MSYSTANKEQQKVAYTWQLRIGLSKPKTSDFVCLIRGISLVLCPWLLSFLLHPPPPPPRPPARSSRQALVTVGPEDTAVININVLCWFRVTANSLPPPSPPPPRLCLPPTASHVCWLGLVWLAPPWETMNLLTGVQEEEAQWRRCYLHTLTSGCLGEVLSNAQINKIKLFNRTSLQYPAISAQICADSRNETYHFHWLSFVLLWTQNHLTLKITVWVNTALSSVPRK